MSGECDGCGVHCTECHCDTPPHANCAYCFEEKKINPAPHFVTCYEEGRALSLCDGHLRKVKDELAEKKKEGETKKCAQE